MNIKKTGKVLVLIAAAAALVSSVVKDKKQKNEVEDNQK